MNLNELKSKLEQEPLLKDKYENVVSDDKVSLTRPLILFLPDSSSFPEYFIQ